MKYISSLQQIAEALVVSGNCLLAVDESVPTTCTWLVPHGVGNKLKNRQAYRENILKAYFHYLANYKITIIIFKLVP
ncbi:class I fructose-bisphosphate aldolase [Candidatus Pelagisphaera phototrophica]|uniref:class I fructose-bisphosphate aldolase n=1 Tax=Candidatus Pelagisphaera phototrophica TaxID=2684113 RepID=UPI0019E1B6E4|nr:fructose-bisphosphate aldolase [Candidatus Pelagisphaera phototrophica]